MPEASLVGHADPSQDSSRTFVARVAGRCHSVETEGLESQGQQLGRDRSAKTPSPVGDINGIGDLPLLPAAAADLEFTEPDNGRRLLGDSDVAILRVVRPRRGRVLGESFGVGSCVRPPRLVSARHLGRCPLMDGRPILDRDRSQDDIGKHPYIQAGDRGGVVKRLPPLPGSDPLATTDYRFMVRYEALRRRAT